MSCFSLIVQCHSRINARCNLNHRSSRTKSSIDPLKSDLILGVASIEIATGDSVCDRKRDKITCGWGETDIRLPPAYLVGHRCQISPETREGQKRSRLRGISLCTDLFGYPHIVTILIISSRMLKIIIGY
jgi:hypothetical protein